MKFSYKEAKTLCKEMWNFLAKTGSHDKWGWQPENSNLINILDKHNYCFACIIAGVKEGYATRKKCKLCPIKWPERTLCWENSLGKEPGLFDQWEHCYNVKKRKILAKKIANLPWKKRKPRRRT